MVDVVDLDAVALAGRLLLDQLKTIAVIQVDVKDEVDDPVDKFCLTRTVGTQHQDRPVFRVSIDFTENHSLER